MAEHRNLEAFINTIRRNCDVSDAGGASIFSICGMALRLRDLNKWEKGLHPWEENDPAELLNWIDNKEQLWEKIGESGFIPLPLLGSTYDPFDTQAINRELAPLGLFYGAGYAHSLKPAFFLARIQKTVTVNDVTVQVLGRELLRDLLTIPALNQDDEVILRQDAARLFLWDQMAYLKKSGLRFLRFALRRCGLPDTDFESRKSHFKSILSNQLPTYIHHEIGELKDQVFNRQKFREILSQFPHTPVELLTRTIKDLLADTGPKGTLAHIVSTNSAAALGFYAAFQDGLFRPLFPQLRQAVEKFVSDNDWEVIEQAREEGFRTARKYAHDLMAIIEEGRDKKIQDGVAAEINRKLVEPLID